MEHFSGFLVRDDPNTPWNGSTFLPAGFMPVFFGNTDPSTWLNAVLDRECVLKKKSPVLGEQT